MRRRNCLAILAALLLACVSSGLWAATNGYSPKGKPFIAINEQIVEVQGAVSNLQDQIDELVGQVDTMEARVAATEGAVANLQNADLALQTLIDQNATDITTINILLADLQEENLTLQAQIANNSGDISSLQDQVAENETLIGSLQSAVLAVENGLISLSTDLQSQIDHNNVLIAALQSEINQLTELLALKLLLDNEECPDGGLVQEIQVDGTVVCGLANGSLDLLYLYRSGTVAPYSYSELTTWCPSGYMVTGGGYGMNFDGSYWQFPAGDAWGHTGWRAYFRNASSYEKAAMLYTICLKLTD